MNAIFEQIGAFFMSIIIAIMSFLGLYSEPEVPETTAEIMRIYQTAVADFNENVPAFVKETSTTVNSAAFKVLGITDSETVTAFNNYLLSGNIIIEKVGKGSANTEYLYFKNPTLDEIESATCEITDDELYYNITFVLKNEISKGKSVDSLAKVTDNYRDASEINAFLTANGYTASSTEVKLSNITVKATVSVESSRMTALSITFDETVTFTELVKNRIVSYSASSYSASNTIRIRDISDWKAAETTTAAAA